MLVVAITIESFTILTQSEMYTIDGSSTRVGCHLISFYVQTNLYIAHELILISHALWFPSPIYTTLFVLAKVLLKGTNFTSLGMWVGLWESMLAELRPSLSEPFIYSTQVWMGPTGGNRTILP